MSIDLGAVADHIASLKAQTSPKHRARPKLVTLHRERQAEREHHMWAAQGLERPTHRGRHTAQDTRQAVSA